MVLCLLRATWCVIPRCLFRDGRLSWHPQGPPLPPFRARHKHFQSRPPLTGSSLAVRASPHFALLLSAFGLGLVPPVACLGGAVPGALLTRYGLEGSSVNRVGVSTPLVHNPCSHV